MKRKALLGAAFVAVLLVVSARGQADVCGDAITRSTLASCVRGRSPGVRMAHEDVLAAEGRRTEAAPWLPSNPVLAANAAHREGSPIEPPTINWQASLAQEIEIAGQRGARLRAGDEKLASERYRASATERDALARAWTAYFEALAADEVAVLASALAASSQAFVTASIARAEKGLAAALDADLARAAAIRFEQARLAAVRAGLAARAALAALVDADPGMAVRVEGTLDPLVPSEQTASGSRVSATRPDIQAAEAEARAEDARASAFRRERVPNPTISLFVGREELDRTFYGAGIALPIPLPEPVGRTHTGEIAEAEARGRRSALEAERLRRAAVIDTATAHAAYASRREEVALFRPDDVARASESLRALAEEVSSGRLGIREAVMAEQSLLEMLRASVEARRDLCLASVELAKVSGASLDGRTR